MPNKFKITFLLWLVLAGSCLAAAISFNPQDVGIGARPLALGRAYVALADDASALFINPAGLAASQKLKAISMYSTLLEDTRYFVLGGANTYSFGTLGLGLVSVASPNIPIYQFIGGVPTIVDYTNYNSSVILVSYSRYIRENLLLGANLKIFSQGYTGGGITYEASSGSGTDIDLGIKYLPNEWLSLGLSAQNILPASLGGRVNLNTTPKTEESIPALFKAGLAAKIFGTKALRKAKTELRLLFDYDFSLTGISTSHLGLEYRPFSQLAVRLGSDAGNLAAGLGFEYANFTFDYAYRVLAGPAGNISHAFSVGYLGSLPGKKALPKVAAPPKKAKREISILIFIDVPDDHYAKESIEKLAALEVIPGYADGTFKPDKEITRAELALALVRSLGVKISPEPFPERIFKDIPREHWSAAYVKEAVHLKWINGYPDGTFRPNWPISRAEMVAVLSRFDKFPKVAVAVESYADIPVDHWAASGVETAKKQGMLGFVEQEDFAPQKKVTRAELAEMLYHTQTFQARIKKEFKE